MGPRATDNTGVLLAMLDPGTPIGAYAIERRVASRGTGQVYVARHTVHDERVTLVVRPAAGTRPRGLLFGREPIGELDHPGIPRLLDEGVLADHRPWVATELVEGRTLDTLLGLTPFDIAAILRDIADILDHAHVRGVSHRHLTPYLIVLPDEPRRFPLCVTDWTAGGSATPLAAIPYLAPEQRRGDVADNRVDVYALGAIARELARRAAGALPPVLSAIIARMVAADPAQRPSAFEVRDHAAWLADQLRHERTVLPAEPPRPRQRAITSEVATSVSGEIHPRRS